MAGNLLKNSRAIEELTSNILASLDEVVSYVEHFEGKTGIDTEDLEECIGVLFRVRNALRAKGLTDAGEEIYTVMRALDVNRKFV